ncbi:SAM-dependent methyltransferase [Paenibacillaceae sp. P-4]|uniref:SAM-dependent methyltransferase n=1 Tax=Paenibacillaceae bacterium P-4 TaxID=3160969 RepID=UPI0032E8281F
MEEGQQRYRFSEAPIWDLQRAYYERKGLKAWNNDQVPQYITSNPMIATGYADIIFGFLRDRAERGERSEPVVIMELGAGAGRLAFHILHKLCELRDDAGISLPPFRYVMTDLAAKNVEGWREHPQLKRFVEQGILDFAAFDAVHDKELNLTIAQETIRPGDLTQPLLILANYFFDSIPQELIYVGNGEIYECDVLVEFKEEDDAAQVDPLRNMTLTYEHRRAPAYEDDAYPYREVIALYQQELEDSHVLFPEVGLRCLDRLNKLSQQGFVLLTADKGDHRLDNWKFNDPPEIVHHGGSFSLTANYHAFQYAFEQRGGLALFPPNHYKDINVGCIFMLEDPHNYVNTRLAYHQGIERFGPDDFFSLKVWVDRHLDTMDLQHILAFWRLGGYDAEFFIQSAKQISSLLPDANDEEMLDIQQGIHIMWSAFYFMEQKYDVALDSGLILFEMGMYEDAKQFLETSVASDDDPVATVIFCLAICCYELGQEDTALKYTREALVLEPDHEEALELLRCFE